MNDPFDIYRAIAQRMDAAAQARREHRAATIMHEAFFHGRPLDEATAYDLADRPRDWASFTCEMCGATVNDQSRLWDAVALWVALTCWERSADDDSSIRPLLDGTYPSWE